MWGFFTIKTILFNNLGTDTNEMVLWSK